MEKLMQREKDVFSLKSEEEEEEMDFNDVFGGPPKRFSMRLSSESEEESAAKPVFGEEVRGRRRQNNQADEFFNDIFKASSPTSNPMSPLPPKPTHHSLPPHFSLPAKVTKGMELPTFGSSSPPLSRFSSRSSHDDEMREEVRHPSCFILTNDQNEDNTFHQFHFSIYKWAGKGVPMLNDFKSNLSTNSKGRKLDIRSSNQPTTKHHVDKEETKDTVALKKEQTPVKKETQSTNTQPIHAFLNEDDHQEIKDKKPKAPRVDEMINKRVEKASSLKLGEESEKKKSREVEAAKYKKLGHASIKVVEDLNKHQPQPSKPSTNPNITSSSGETLAKENAGDPLDDNFMVEEIFDAQENVAQSESCDETKAIDAKIRQWSIGKKGNIRSLLSTLQYVLWADSGWKPVPLVDLIEANAVKRAYQKALLRLHPDKLQQKAASFHHKYTAEKVFDILQEAWDHFNSSALIV